jgi:hypothetical protein
MISMNYFLIILPHRLLHCAFDHFVTIDRKRVKSEKKHNIKKKILRRNASYPPVEQIRHLLVAPEANLPLFSKSLTQP